ncbi:hypothetical protein, no similarity [Maudiozyma saulgeensis]|uniref:Uncharacterized protein n=1 Tax=Maudiozyma saulgeensis TaxID=1789683 RepID=A0A1X7R397_9SACH|nr:hypothetical protein, no similarity [Kazachstania saulgeensis]
MKFFPITITIFFYFNVLHVDATEKFHKPTYNEEFNSSITKVTNFIMENYHSELANNCTKWITELVTIFNSKYNKRQECKFILTKLFQHKLTHMIEDKESEDSNLIQEHNCNQIIKSLQFANNFAPKDMYKRAAKHVTTLTKNQFNEMLKIFTRNETNSDTSYNSLIKDFELNNNVNLIKRESRFPRTELFLKHLTIVLVMAAGLMDTCGNVSMFLCRTMLILFVFTLTYWMVEVSRILFDMNFLTVENILPL